VKASNLGVENMKKIIRSAWDEDWSVMDEMSVEETIYDKQTRERMVDEGVIEAWEAAFLDGAMDDMEWDEAS